MSGFFAGGTWWDVTQAEMAVINDAAARLADAGIEDAMGEARQLFAAAQASSDVDLFPALINRRAAREPFSHLVGYRDFYKYRFTVSPAVLDPRPETETLVAMALRTLFDRVLDLGVGSGCILLSLLKDHPQAIGVGADLSEDALGVARQNASALMVDQQVTFICSDWYQAVEGTFDLIVSNPPYIAASEMADLEPEVRDHEPRMALTDEDDGLTCYRKIVAGAPDYLTPGGWLMVEIGPTQATAVRAMLVGAGFGLVAVTQDLDGRDRVVSGQKTHNT